TRLPVASRPGRASRPGHPSNARAKPVAHTLSVGHGSVGRARWWRAPVLGPACPPAFGVRAWHPLGGPGCWDQSQPTPQDSPLLPTPPAERVAPVARQPGCRATRGIGSLWGTLPHVFLSLRDPDERVV